MARWPTRAPRARESTPGISLLEYLSVLRDVFEPTPAREPGDRLRRVRNRWPPKQPRACNRRSGDLRLPGRSPADRVGQTVERRSLTAKMLLSVAGTRSPSTPVRRQARIAWRAIMPAALLQRLSPHPAARIHVPGIGWSAQ